ncbi:MAG: DUF4143 domain-containing protein [Chitinivibrionales bacterium]|nr:DUF4143 domain-containing protein [Chitinivibrionales bacterium]
MIARTMEQKLKSLAAAYPLVTLTGPRQSGKTTLCRSAFPDYQYLSFEDPDVREFATTDARRFLQTYADRCIFDEVQRVPNLFSYLQSHVDRTDRSGQYILTGSQNFLLAENVTQSLAGRTALLNLLPFSMAELDQAGLLSSHLDEVLFQGGYPRLYDHAIPPPDFYPYYITTYVERDVRLLKNITDLSLFDRFLKLCAGRIGSQVNLSSLANDCGITHNTARAWLSVLEASYILFFLKPYFRNFNKRLVKSPKLYFYDTGLACSLLGLEEARQLSSHHLRGELFESLMLSELVKCRSNQGRQPNIYYWRDKAGHEVDCLIEKGDELIAVEFKSGQTIANDYFSGLAYWRKLTGPGKRYVVYGGGKSQERSGGVVLPWRNVGETMTAMPGLAC